MDKMKRIEELFNLLKNEGNFELEDGKITYTSDDGKIKAVLKKQNVEPEEENEEDFQSEVEYFKEQIQELDDDIFVEVMEELSDEFPSHRFDKLLNKENHSKKEQEELRGYMDSFKETTVQKIQEAIDHLSEMQESFL